MGQFSVEKSDPNGSDLSGNQQLTFCGAIGEALDQPFLHKECEDYHRNDRECADGG